MNLSTIKTFADTAYGLAIATGIIARGLFRSPHPMTTEQRLATLPRIGLPVAAPVTIHWDDHQIPFIEADSDDDLAVALGVVHAHLRLGQIEVMRRLAFGRVAEMIGPLGIEIDRSLRLMDFGRAVPEIIAGLPETTRRWADGFVRGLNHHLAHAPALPHEFSLLGLKPEPWTLTDLFTLTRLSSADISWLVWVRLLRTRARMAPREWRQLWPRLLTGGSPCTFAATTGDIAEQALAASTRSGSNSSAVAANRSITGAPMIASDPHLPLGLPNPWLIAAVKSPSIHAAGLMMPGLPFIALGRNRTIAWGGTSLHAQGSDLFDISRLPPDDFAERTEIIRVRGAGRRALKLRESPLGPVVSDGALLKNPYPTALRWIGHRPSDEIGAMLAVAKAENWEMFRSALGGFAVSGLNMVFAGSEGRIAHCMAAHLPRRPAEYPTDLVLSPEAVKNWDDIVAGRDLPTRIDPPDGFVASANERPPRSDFPLGFFFAPNDRAQRLAVLLGGAGKLATDDLKRLQQDVLAPGVLPLRDLLLHRLPHRKRSAGQHRLIETLRQWDGSYDHRQSGSLAFEILLAETVAALGGSSRIKPYQTVWMAQSLLTEDLLETNPEILAHAIEQALAPASRRLSRLGSWGGVHRIRLQHFLGRLPLLGRRYRLADFPADGGNNTVHKTGHSVSSGRHTVSFGSCARHISDLADLDANQFVLLGGQDGWLGSANFADQVELWRRGGYITVPLRPETARTRFRHKTVLQPASAPITQTPEPPA